MQPIARGGEPLDELQNPLFAALRVGVGDGHSILGSVTVAQSRAPAHLNEGGEPGKHHVDFALIQRPGIEHHVHARIRGGHLELGQLVLPKPGQAGQGFVYRGQVAVLFPGCAVLPRRRPPSASTPAWFSPPAPK